MRLLQGEKTEEIGEDEISAEEEELEGEGIRKRKTR